MFGAGEVACSEFIRAFLFDENSWLLRLEMKPRRHTVFSITAAAHTAAQIKVPGMNGSINNYKVSAKYSCDFLERDTSHFPVCEVNINISLNSLYNRITTGLKAAE